MPTFRLLIHSESCENSSSSSCDRGIIKSTHSLKTKPWVWQQFGFGPLNLDIECGTPSSACFPNFLLQFGVRNYSIIVIYYSPVGATESNLPWEVGLSDVKGKLLTKIKMFPISEILRAGGQYSLGFTCRYVYGWETVRQPVDLWQVEPQWYLRFSLADVHRLTVKSSTFRYM